MAPPGGGGGVGVRFFSDLYQVCSCLNYTEGVKNGPALGSNVLHRLIQGKQKKIFLSETTGPRALMFGK